MLGVIGSLDQHLDRLQNERTVADIVQYDNVNDAMRALHNASTQAEALDKSRKRTREAASSAQSVARSSPPDTENVQTRSKKRVKRSPLPITEPPLAHPASVPRRSARRNGRSYIAVAQAASAPRRSARRENSDLASTITAQLARAPTRKINIGSSREYLGEKGREGEEEMDDSLHAIDQQESTLDDDDLRGGGEKILVASPAAQKRRAATKSFDERFNELVKFKQKFGHCNVPCAKSSEYYSFGQWCGIWRTSYRIIQQGGTPRYKLLEEHIRLLEQEGFKWTLNRSRFDERFEELMKFKQKFGHCNVSTSAKSSGYTSLGNWCGDVRKSYRKIQRGESLQNCTPLSDEKIRRLEEAGFQWSPNQLRFDVRFEELMKFKQKFGHCNVSATKRTKYYLLGRWCLYTRESYRKIQQGEAPHTGTLLTDANIRRLENEGFMWTLPQRK